ncbi:uncharacterized protein BXZ73DRAFT_83404 [Epithele typhae]|uniref:uncharacterized protein n=1 Tax=Epithele typhae TaxID=378194 RepID=UPI002007EB7B|nr:uncharacterized protein BXZ73DRAFT_83404 [Epithele typhae]KAH9910608.1 hypothetical protein BXZ73DRAFT_83404 [Epithele typhae]
MCVICAFGACIRRLHAGIRPDRAVFGFERGPRASLARRYPASSPHSSSACLPPSVRAASSRVRAPPSSRPQAQELCGGAAVSSRGPNLLWYLRVVFSATVSPAPRVSPHLASRRTASRPHLASRVSPASSTSAPRGRTLRPHGVIPHACVAVLWGRGSGHAQANGRARLALALVRAALVHSASPTPPLNSPPRCQIRVTSSASPTSLVSPALPNLRHRIRARPALAPQAHVSHSTRLALPRQVAAAVSSTSCSPASPTSLTSHPRRHLLCTRVMPVSPVAPSPRPRLGPASPAPPTCSRTARVTLATPRRPFRVALSTSPTSPAPAGRGPARRLSLVLRIVLSATRRPRPPPALHRPCHPCIVPAFPASHMPWVAHLARFVQL